MKSMRQLPDALVAYSDSLDGLRDFLRGVRTITTAGDVSTHTGMGAHVYLITRSMKDEYFYDADGELVRAAQSKLRLYGIRCHSRHLAEIAVIPRGVKLRVELVDGPARGYLCENYAGAFSLPERGPIGANCLANPRDFLTPVAAYEDSDIRLTTLRQMGRYSSVHEDRSFAVGCRGLARQLCAVQV